MPWQYATMATNTPSHYRNPGNVIQGYKDGYYYDFYYGDITVTVSGNFGSVSDTVTTMDTWAGESFCTGILCERLLTWARVTSA